MSSDLTNSDRAARAEKALRAYDGRDRELPDLVDLVDHFRGTKALDDQQREQIEQVAADLIGDLLHLLERTHSGTGEDEVEWADALLGRIVERGAGHWAAEVLEDDPGPWRVETA